MTKILLLNGGKAFAHSAGRYNSTLHEAALAFFEGKGVDAVYLPVHKAHPFLGMRGLPTFLCADVMKQPDIEGDVARYRRHLAEVFAAR